MFVNLQPSTHEAAHNLINLRLFPDCHLRLGQFDHYTYHGAETVWERTGNLYTSSQDAITYWYNIDGPGFSICLLAIWPDQHCATADVHIIAITPDREAETSFQDWLTHTWARRPPQNAFTSPS